MEHLYLHLLFLVGVKQNTFSIFTVSTGTATGNQERRGKVEMSPRFMKSKFGKGFHILFSPFLIVVCDALGHGIMDDVAYVRPAEEDQKSE
jgi:hypothetical protein